jgi:hypothetical protein
MCILVMYIQIQSILFIAASYPCWLVILTVYNLPLYMCLRSEFMFLSTIILDPNSPGQNIDICLRLLIDELK